MGFLKLIGAVSAAEHGELLGKASDAQREVIRLKSDLADTERKFKLVIKDLEAEVRERKSVQYDLGRAKLEIAALRPDAKKWRDRAARELQRGQAKRGKGK